MCEACKIGEEEGFSAIKEYIEENEESTLGEISKATGVSVKKILGYVREGRLMATSGMAGDITCKSCGEPVTIGNFCEACMLKLNKGIKDAYSDDNSPKVETKRTGIKMQIKDKF